MHSSINGNLVNVDNSQYSGAAFTSRVIPSTVNPNVMPQPLTKGQAANSYIPCSSGGGRGKRRINFKSTSKKIYKNKINNISSMYKMRGRKSRSRARSLKKRIRSRFLRKPSKSSSRKRNSKTRRSIMRGGYAQYQNNLPMTQTYSLGGKLDPASSALANPPIYKTLSNCTNCVDNYSYFKNSGFPSKGWY